MSEIHYFPRYSQPENLVTNNTLLLLLRLHEYNRFKFERFLDAICAEQEVQLASSWLQFRQQKGTGKSVADGFIAQESVKIAVETKLTERFDVAQLKNHLAIFEGEQNKLLILLTTSIGNSAKSQLASVRAKATPRNIQIVHTSFEDIVDKARSCLSEHDEEMHALVSDYEALCSEMELLPRDQYMIFTPPCRLSMPANIDFRLYYHPAARTIRKAKYLGIYGNRSVQAIGKISKAVAVTVSAKSVAVIDDGVSLTADEEKRILGATKEALNRDWNLRKGHRFWLCDELEKTDFRKSSPGGIMGKRYIDLEKVLGPKTKIPANLPDLATLLRQHTWK